MRCAWFRSTKTSVLNSAHCPRVRLQEAGEKVLWRAPKGRASAPPFRGPEWRFSAASWFLRGRRGRVSRHGELFWGTPRVGAPKEGKKAADAGRGQIYDTVIVIITALLGCQALF